MACGITGDYIYQRLQSTETKSEKDIELICTLLFPESNLSEAETGGDQEEAKGGTHGR
jgi:hypothetical protein